MQHKEPTDMMLFEVPEKLKRDIKAYCVANRISIKSFLGRIIKEALDKIKSTSS